MSLFERKIAVALVDASSSTELGRTRMRSSDLPETFTQHTVMRIGGEPWRVVSAAPVTREECRRKKCITLSLQRVKADPTEILYSLPTLCDMVPPSDGPDVDGSEVTLHQDSWRQVELISRSYDPVITGEIEQIRVIYDRHCTSVGFEAMHVRRAIPEPLSDVLLDFASLTDLISIPESFSVAFARKKRRIPHGFAMSLGPEFILYGVESGGRVRHLGILVGAKAEGCPVPSECIRTLAGRYDLVLIDWCACAGSGPDEERFTRMLQARRGG